MADTRTTEHLGGVRRAVSALPASRNYANEFNRVRAINLGVKLNTGESVPKLSDEITEVYFSKRFSSSHSININRVSVRGPYP